MKQLTLSNQRDSLQRIQLRRRVVKTFLVYFDGDGQLRGYWLDWVAYPKSIEGYRFAYLILGERTNICFVSDDRRVRCAHCDYFAAAILAEKTVTTTIWLTEANAW